MRTEPPPSEVVASGTMPAASAAADPPLDPLGVCERLLRTQCNHGVQRWVVGLDAPQRLGDQLPGVQLARSNPLDQLGPHRNLPLVEQ